MIRLRTAILLLAAAGAAAQSLQLTSPPDQARPQSSYVDIVGRAAPSASVEICDGATTLTTLAASSTGNFERVLRLSPGAHELRVRSNGAEAVLHVTVASHPAPRVPAPYESLRTGDVILAHDRDSQQDGLYRPTYTHAALSIGPGADGSPLLLEAVSEDNATSHGPVAAVTIEESLGWRDADRVDLFRPAEPLSDADLTRLTTWARVIAARGMPFRSTGDFGDIYRLWLLWDPKLEQPRDAAEFDRMLAALRERLTVTDSYDCATLVWHAFRDNTAAHIDLASPNRIQLGGAGQQESKRLIEILRPLLIVPDSFALSGKLRRVESR